jgi:hypothetical protein
MKKNISALFFAFTIMLSYPLFAQKERKFNPAQSATNNDNRGSQFYYTFSHFNQTYNNLVNPISLNQGMVWDDPQFQVPIPFNFTVMGKSISILDFSFGLGGLLVGETTTPSLYEALFPFDADLIDRGYASGVSQSPISYVVDGNPGSRILKIEWQNVGSYDEGDINGTYDMFINFQCWLYEGSNVIEYRFGNNNITDDSFYYGDQGTFIGAIEVLETDTMTYFNEVHFLTDSASTPILTDEFENLIGTPPSGKVYRFAPPSSSGIAGRTGKTLSVNPNPALETINLSNASAGEHYAIFDITGNQIGASIMITAENQLIDVRQLSKGVYFIKNLNQSDSVVRFIKQ